jgi:hypothetical protein
MLVRMSSSTMARTTKTPNALVAQPGNAAIATAFVLIEPLQKIITLAGIIVN